MGMDLVPIDASNADDEECQHFHANWSGWGALASMLESLGVDMTHFSGSNDGDIVPEEHAVAWGQAVEENYDNLYVLDVEDPDAPDWARGRIVILPGTNYDLITWSRFKGDNGQLRVKIRRVSDSENLSGFIKHFAKFCRNSGGFAQY